MADSSSQPLHEGLQESKIRRYEVSKGLQPCIRPFFLVFTSWPIWHSQTGFLTDFRAQGSRRLSDCPVKLLRSVAVEDAKAVIFNGSITRKACMCMSSLMMAAKRLSSYNFLKLKSFRV